MPLGPAPRNAPTPTVRYCGSRQLLNFHRRSHKTQESGAGQTHQTGDSASRLMGDGLRGLHPYASSRLRPIGSGSGQGPQATSGQRVI